MSVPSPTDFDPVATKVVELRCAGYSIDYIKKTVGIGTKRIERILNNEFKKFADRDRIKNITAARYEYLIRPLMERYLAAGMAVDRKDAEVLATLLRDQRKLFALDDPVKVEVTHIEEMSDEELYKELQLHTTEIKQLPPAAISNHLVEPEIMEEEQPCPTKKEL
jgi:hypothetical protein